MLSRSRICLLHSLLTNKCNTRTRMEMKALARISIRCKCTVAKLASLHASPYDLSPLGKALFDVNSRTHKCRFHAQQPDRLRLRLRLPLIKAIWSEPTMSRPQLRDNGLKTGTPPRIGRKRCGQVSGHLYAMALTQDYVLGLCYFCGLPSPHEKASS